MNNLTRKQIADACADNPNLTFCGKPVNGNKPIISGQPVVGSSLPAKGTVIGSIGFEDSCEGLRILIQEIQGSLATEMIVDVLPNRSIAVIFQPM